MFSYKTTESCKRIWWFINLICWRLYINILVFSSELCFAANKQRQMRTSHRAQLVTIMQAVWSKVLMYAGMVGMYKVAGVWRMPGLWKAAADSCHLLWPSFPRRSSPCLSHTNCLYQILTQDFLPLFLTGTHTALSHPCSPTHTNTHRHTLSSFFTAPPTDIRVYSLQSSLSTHWSPKSLCSVTS